MIIYALNEASFEALLESFRQSCPNRKFAKKHLARALSAAFGFSSVSMLGWATINVPGPKRFDLDRFFGYFEKLGYSRDRVLSYFEPADLETLTCAIGIRDMRPLLRGNPISKVWLDRLTEELREAEIEEIRFYIVPDLDLGGAEITGPWVPCANETDDLPVAMRELHDLGEGTLQSAVLRDTVYAIIGLSMSTAAGPFHIRLRPDFGLWVEWDDRRNAARVPALFHQSEDLMTYVRHQRPAQNAALDKLFETLRDSRDERYEILRLLMRERGNILPEERYDLKDGKEQTGLLASVIRERKAPLHLARSAVQSLIEEGMVRENDTGLTLSWRGLHLARKLSHE